MLEALLIPLKVSLVLEVEHVVLSIQVALSLLWGRINTLQRKDKVVLTEATAICRECLRSG